MIAPFPAGSSVDAAARVITPRVGEALGQSIVIDNRAGASGAIGAELGARAAPDGYTISGGTTSTHALSKALNPHLSYDPEKDFAPITMFGHLPYILAVHPGVPASNLQELIAIAKAKPGQINFSSAGTGSGTHFAGEMFKQSAGIDIVHIPFKGIPESLTDAISGRVQFTMAPIASSVSLIKEGRLRAVGVTSKKRSSLYPELPTLGEQGLTGFEWDSWGGLLAPAKTPRAVINKLNREVVKILAMPEIIERMRALGAEPTATTPEEMDAFVARQLKTAMQLAKKAGIEPQ